MRSRDLPKFCAPTPEALEVLRAAIAELNFSARAYDRILKVARTIADLAGDERIESTHMAEAIGCRRADALRESDRASVPAAHA
jgi:magnesium chelatase family protein